jgi:hypothetical protein
MLLLLLVLLPVPTLLVNPELLASAAKIAVNHTMIEMEVEIVPAEDTEDMEETAVVDTVIVMIEGWTVVGTAEVDMAIAMIEELLVVEIANGPQRNEYWRRLPAFTSETCFSMSRPMISSESSSNSAPFKV